MIKSKKWHKDHIEEIKILLAKECFKSKFVNSGLTWHRKITYFKANIMVYKTINVKK